MNQKCDLVSHFDAKVAEKSKTEMTASVKKTPNKSKEVKNERFLMWTKTKQCAFYRKN